MQHVLKVQYISLLPKYIKRTSKGVFMCICISKLVVSRLMNVYLHMEVFKLLISDKD
jgi:hypothetical protein